MVETHVESGLAFSVLGPLAADREGRPIELGAPKQRAVLAVLLAHPNQPISVGRIITAVWGSDASESFRRSVQTYVSNLRAVLDTEIPHNGDNYMLAIDPFRIDAVLFEETLEEAASLIATDPALAARRLREALAMWRGRPYADVADVEGIQTEINRIEELRLTAVELRIDAELAAGRHRELVAEVEALAAEYPLRERFRAQHMIALYRAGRQTEALRVFERTREYLGEELGIDPSRELQDLELAILRHDHELASGTGIATTQRLAFLSSSIENLNEAWDRNPQVMGESVWRLNEAIATAVDAHGGRVIHESGEGLGAVFGEVNASVLAAELAQREVAAIDWGDLEPLAAGVAIDVGEAESRGERFSGPPVTRVRRLALKAWGGQILLSSAVQEVLASSSISGLQIRLLGEFDLEGFAKPERVAQLVVESLVSDFEGLRPSQDWVEPDGSVSFSLPGYEIREVIGRGAVGAVYRAYQPTVGREVAIKVIRPTMSNHPRFFNRFETEARVIARLAHPHIVPLIDFWRDAEGAYLVLQYMPGGSLGDALDQGGLQPEMAHRVIGQVTSALEHAHDRGVAHGDVSPNNILLDESDNAYLADFDIASRLLDQGVQGGVSIPAAFQAPELADTGPSQAADIYAFGMLIDVLVDDPTLVSVVEQATAADVNRRFPSARALFDAFEAALGQEIAAPGPIATRNPYKGLRPFDEIDSGDFYGRDALVADLVARVEELRFVAVVGPSGSGKSSVVRAGLLPALARGAVDGSEDWPTLVMTPGTHPVESLVEGLETLATKPLQIRNLLSERGLGGTAETLLQDAAGELALVVDQFEELFSQSEHPEERRSFIDLMVDAVRSDSPMRVIVTLRADFYQHLLDEAGVNELARDGQVTVLPPTREEVIEMITCPAESVGLAWVPGLPERIASEIVNQTGGLPLLQYALTEVVENRADTVLTESDYEVVGGVAGALIRRADHVFEGLPREQQPLVRDIFLRLVQVDQRGDGTRRRVRRSELESLGVNRKELDIVLGPFIAERLLLGDRDPTTRAPTVEVAHEALLSSWPRLAGWIDDERDSLLLARRLRSAREEWVKANKDGDYLLTGARLTPFAEWARTARLSAEERNYLERSIRADEQRQEYLQRRRRALAVVLGIAATVAVVLSVWALIERDRASQQALRADQASDLARSRELAASAVGALDEDPRLSKLLAVAAADVADLGPETLLALHEAYVADRVTDTYRWTISENPVGLWTDIHPGGDLLVASGSGPAEATGTLARNLEVFDLTTDQALWSMEVADGLAIGPAFFTPNGDQVVAGVFAEGHSAAGNTAGVHVMDPATGSRVSHIDLGKCGGIVIGVSGGAALVITVSSTPERCLLETDVEHQLETVDLETGERRLILSSRIGATIVNATGISAVMSEDGRYLAYGGLDDGEPDVTIMEVSTGEIVQTFEVNEPRPKVQDLSEDGSLIAYGAFPVRVAEVDSGEVIAEIFRRSPGIPTATFDNDGNRLYVSGPEADLLVWDTNTDRELDSVPAAGSGPISTSATGRLLVTDSDSQSAVVIDNALRGEVLTLPLPDCFIASGGLEATGDHLLAHQACPDGLVTTVASAQTGETVYSLEGAHGQSFAVSPNGAQLVRQEGTGIEILDTLAVRELGTGALVTRLSGLCRWDAKSTAEPGHAQEGCSAFPSPPFPFWVWDLEWSPDGTLIAASHDPTSHGGLAAWDAASGSLIGAHDFGPGRSAADLVFTPDSSQILVSVIDRSGPTTIQRIDIETWELVGTVEVAPGGGESNMLGLLGWGPDGRLIGVSGWRGSGAALVWFDGDTLEVSQRRNGIHDGSPRDGSLDQSGRLVATASSDGGVRVWDAVTGDLLHEIRLGEVSINAMDFVNQHHLLIGTNEGDALVMTTDPEELVSVVSDSLTRGFTPAECERFNFGNDCPTLEDVRRR